MFSAAKLPKKQKAGFRRPTFFHGISGGPGDSDAVQGDSGYGEVGYSGPVLAARFLQPGFGGLVSGRHRFRRRCGVPAAQALPGLNLRVQSYAGPARCRCRSRFRKLSRTKRSTPGISRGACVPAAVGSSELPAQRVPWCLIWRPACCSVRRRCAAAWRQRASQRPCIRQRPSSSPYRQPGSL